MSEPPSEPPPEPPPIPVPQLPLPIAEDTPCIQCNYNLRTLLPTGDCPECGNPIAPSLGNPLLRYAPNRWTRILLRGTRIYVWALPLFFATAMIFGCAGLAGLSTITLTLVTLYTIADFIAVWLITRRDHRRPNAIDPWSVAARIGMAASLVQRVLDLIQPATLVPGAERATMLSLYLFCQALLGLGYLGLLRVIAGVARRAEGPRLARHALIIGPVLGVVPLLAALLVTGRLLLSYLNYPLFLRSLTFVSMQSTRIIAILIAFIATVWVYIIVARFHVLVRRQVSPRY